MSKNLWQNNDFVEDSLTSLLRNLCTIQTQRVLVIRSGRGCRMSEQAGVAEESAKPSKEEIYLKLVNALLEEFDVIRKELEATRYAKHKRELWINLFKCAETLRALLLAQPDGADIDDWLQMIQQKAPRKFVKVAKEVLKRGYRSSGRGSA